MSGLPRAPRAPHVRRLEAHEGPAYRRLRLAALADAPDAFGSTLERETAWSDEAWAERVEAGAASATDLPLVVERGGGLVGLAWGRIEAEDPGTAHVYQMWVAPQLRRGGLGADLLAAIVAWARDARARQVVLDVTDGNTPARRLYEKAGFTPVGAPRPLRPGSALLSQRMSRPT